MTAAFYHRLQKLPWIEKKFIKDFLQTIYVKSNQLKRIVNPGFNWKVP